jgi:hypothetical protein
MENRPGRLWNSSAGEGIGPALPQLIPEAGKQVLGLGKPLTTASAIYSTFQENANA